MENLLATKRYRYPFIYLYYLKCIVNIKKISNNIWMSDECSNNLRMEGKKHIWRLEERWDSSVITLPISLFSFHFINILQFYQYLYIVTVKNEYLSTLCTLNEHIYANTILIFFCMLILMFHEYHDYYWRYFPFNF